MEIEELVAKRDELLAAARAKVPSIQITPTELAGDATDRPVLLDEIESLTEFVNRPTPGLHLDTVDDNECVDAEGNVYPEHAYDGIECRRCGAEESE